MKIINDLLKKMSKQDISNEEYQIMLSNAMEEMNARFDEAKNKAINSFCDIASKKYPVPLYHGTDRYIYQLKREKREKIYVALNDYLKAVKKSGKVSDDDVKRAMQEEAEHIMIFDMNSNGSTNYQYGCLYTTDSIYRAAIYANSSKYFGELGKVIYGLRHFIKRNNIMIDVAPETESLLNEWFEECDARKPEPIVVKIMGLDFVAAYEDERGFTKEAYLQEMLRNGNTGLRSQHSMRMKSIVSLADFDEIEIESEERDDKEYREHIKELRNRIKSEYDDKIMSIAKDIGPENAEDFSAMAPAMAAAKKAVVYDEQTRQSFKRHKDAFNGLRWVKIIIQKELESGKKYILVVKRKSGKEKGNYDFPGFLFEVRGLAEIRPDLRSAVEEYGKNVELKSVIECEDSVEWVVSATVKDDIKMPEGAEWIALSGYEKYSFTDAASLDMKKYMRSKSVV